jgi:ABC-type amino acid transport substrate-binding protein
MTRWVSSLIALVALSVATARAATNTAPDLAEVLGLLRAHLAGASEADLNQLAVEGLLARLHGKVALVGDTPAPPATNAPALARVSLLESNVAYLRLAGFDPPLAGQVAATLNQFAQTNQLIGLVLDLRFAGGQDYAAAATVAELFQSKARPLMDWGSGSASASARTDAIKLPVAVLINRATAGAAEALAAVLRETGVALLLGNTTEGSALIAEEFPLKNGQRLRIATTPIKVADGLALTTRGVAPDIEVPVNLDEERLWLDDPYGLAPTTAAVPGGSSTNLAAAAPRPSRRIRTNEADLVRARREGLNLDAGPPEPRRTEAPRPLLRDATLSRAVDLLKGLAVVRAARP